MSHRHRDRQLLRQAEGYLELALDAPHGGLPPSVSRRLSRQCLAALDQLSADVARRSPALTMRGHALKLAERYDEAVVALESGAALDQENIHIQLALAWCHKRRSRLDLAILSLEHALEFDPREPVLHYNLACYWSLAGNLQRAVRSLGEAVDRDPGLRLLIADEPDFDPIRHEPAFLAVTEVIV